jgi:hypothetical protein
MTLFVIILLVFDSGCVFIPQRPASTWTVMVYMAGDSSLSSTVDANLAELESVGSSNTLKIVALVDKLGEGDSHLYYIGKRALKDLSLREIWVKHPNEVETGRQETMQSFLKFCKEKYRSDYYLLVIWGHGDGWRGAALDGNDYLTLTELRNSLMEVHPDIIAFDACSMATMECYFELENSTKYIVASEKTVPTGGMPYATIMKKLPGLGPGDASKTITKEYLKAYKNGARDSEKFSIIIAALRTRTGLSGSFSESSENKTCMNFNSVLRFEQKDLADVRSLFNYSDDFFKSINKTVCCLEKWNNPDSPYDVTRASGLAIYYPSADLDVDYNETLLARETKWVNILVNRNQG